MQGTLLFAGLLLLLWVPLIAFSSGNPTYALRPHASMLSRSKNDKFLKSHHYLSVSRVMSLKVEQTVYLRHLIVLNSTKSLLVFMLDFANGQYRI